MRNVKAIEDFLCMNLNCIKLMRAACEINCSQSVKYENPTHATSLVVKVVVIGKQGRSLPSDSPSFTSLCGEPWGWSARKLPLLPLPGQPVLLRGKNSLLSFTACLFPTPEPRVSPSADSMGRATALKPLGNGRVGIISSESIKEAPSAIGVKLAISQCLDLVLNLAT